MSPAAFHAQLASIMEVLANTAVAEILELVDSGYAELRLEISRGRRENELLRRKLRLMELRAARVTALRAASGAAALMHVGGGRARVHVVARSEAPTGETLPSGSTNQEREPEPPSDQEVRPADNSTVIKVEDEEDEEEEKSWRRSEPEEAFRCVVEEPKETEAPPLKQEVADDSGSASSSWTIVEVRTASPPPSTNQRPEAFDRLVFNPLDAGCSSSDSGGGFGFASPSDQQPAGLLGVQRRAAERSGATRRRPDGGGGGRGVGLRGLQAGGKFVCSFCGKTLACLKNLKTHMRVHTGEKPFVCSLCGKRFSDSSNLKRHHSVHTGEKRYGCVHCGKRFAQSGSLKVHMTVHSDCKEFRCSFCGKTFISSSHLRRHVSVHAADKRYAAAAAATPP